MWAVLLLGQSQNIRSKRHWIWVLILHVKLWGESIKLWGNKLQRCCLIYCPVYVSLWVMHYQFLSCFWYCFANVIIDYQNDRNESGGSYYLMVSLWHAWGADYGGICEIDSTDRSTNHTRGHRHFILQINHPATLPRTSCKTLMWRGRVRLFLISQFY